MFDVVHAVMAVKGLTTYLFLVQLCCFRVFCVVVVCLFVVVVVVDKGEFFFM